MTTPVELLESFRSIVTDWTVLDQDVGRRSRFLKLRINFTDGSSLRTFEVEPSEPARRRYGYQWLSPQQQTLYRWDNTPHFPEFDTFPHHRHVGTAETAEPFREMTLEAVLRFIAAQLATSN